MKYILTLISGIAMGCLLMLMLQLPWLRPFDTNTATVLAALSSTVLAVIGAFTLWWHQVRAKQRDLDKIIVPVFEPLYVALCQVRDLSNADSARRLLISVREAIAGAGSTEPSDLEVTAYQDEGFPRAVDAALVEARTVLGHWSSLQDLLLGVSPSSLPGLLALHRTASGAVDRLPKLLADSAPQYLEQMGPQVKPADAALLHWAIGRIANVLNQLDQGKRDESGWLALEPGRAAAIKTWSATDTV